MTPFLKYKQKAKDRQIVEEGLQCDRQKSKQKGNKNLENTDTIGEVQEILKGKRKILKVACSEISPETHTKYTIKYKL